MASPPGLTSFAALKLLAEFGKIPKSLAKVTPPFCTGCQFGAKMRKPWWIKLGVKPSRTTQTHGECDSVNQVQLLKMESQLNSKDAWHGNNTRQLPYLWITYPIFAMFISAKLFLLLKPLMPRKHLKNLQQDYSNATVTMAILLTINSSPLANKQATHLLLWYQCTFSEWNCRATYMGCPR